MLLYTATLGAVSLTTVSAFSFADGIIKIKEGVFYEGYQAPPPYLPQIYPAPYKPYSVNAGWFHNNSIQYVGYEVNDKHSPPASAYQSEDIICNKDARNGVGRVEVKAGETIAVHRTGVEWGPVLDYLAPCNGACEDVDKKDLKFFKISEAGAVLDYKRPDGKGTFESALAFNKTWQITIPKDIKAGPYVLRHEILDLQQNNGWPGEIPQSYPYCFNLLVSSSGKDTPEGVPATQLYKATDPGLSYNARGEGTGGTLSAYPIPGPTVYKGGIKAQQTSFEWPRETIAVY